MQNLSSNSDPSGNPSGCPVTAPTAEPDYDPPEDERGLLEALARATEAFRESLPDRRLHDCPGAWVQTPDGTVIARYVCQPTDRSCACAADALRYCSQHAKVWLDNNPTATGRPPAMVAVRGDGVALGATGTDSRIETFVSKCVVGNGMEPNGVPNIDRLEAITQVTVRPNETAAL